jgi:hypothetical protein
MNEILLYWECGLERKHQGDEHLNSPTIIWDYCCVYSMLTSTPTEPVGNYSSSVLNMLKLKLVETGYLNYC